MPAKRPLPAPRRVGQPSAAPAEQVIYATLHKAQPLTASELREVMRAKLEAILAPLEEAVRDGRVDVLDYAAFLAKYGLGERTVPSQAARKNPVVMLPPRNPVATPLDGIVSVEAVVVEQSMRP